MLTEPEPEPEQVLVGGRAVELGVGTWKLALTSRLLSCCMLR